MRDRHRQRCDTKNSCKAASRMLMFISFHFDLHLGESRVALHTWCSGRSVPLDGTSCSVLRVCYGATCQAAKLAKEPVT